MLAVQDARDRTFHMPLVQREAGPVPLVHIGTLEGKPGALANGISTGISTERMSLQNFKSGERGTESILCANSLSVAC